MFELPVAAALVDFPPAVVMNAAQDVSDLHRASDIPCRCRSAGSETSVVIGGQLGIEADMAMSLKTKRCDRSGILGTL
jgi:hypothetical protein